MHFWSFVFSITTAAALTFAVRHFALLNDISPKNDYRRQQKGAIALWGGLAIYITLIANYLVSYQASMLDILLASSILMVTGLLDDRKELKAATKFTLQFLAAFVWLYLNHGTNLLQLAGMPPFFSLFISTFWIVGLCNAFNLIDGTDGQCSLVALIGFSIVAISFPTLIPTTIPLIGTILGFLLWNFPPAKIYLGESGSTLLGFCMATLTLSLPVQSSAAPIILGALFLPAFPLIDTVLAIARRKIKKRPLFSGDKDHIHHLLQKLGFSKTRLLIIVGFMVLAGDLTAFNLFQIPDLTASLVLTWNNAGLMSFILYGLFYTKKLAAQKVSYFGKSLLEKHVPKMNLEPLDLNSKKAYLIDLLPYYAELQSQGVGVIISFVKEIAVSLKDVTKYDHFSVGSYSIAIVCREGSTWTEEECHMINRELRDIFMQFGVLKSLSETPEGVFYFDHQNINTLFEMIETSSDQQRKAVPLRVAS